MLGQTIFSYRILGKLAVGRRIVAYEDWNKAVMQQVNDLSNLRNICVQQVPEEFLWRLGNN